MNNIDSTQAPPARQAVPPDVPATPTPARPAPQPAPPAKQPPQPQRLPDPPVPRPRRPGDHHFQRSETLAEFAPAFAAAQAEMENASKDADNPFFHSKYADMASVVGAIRPAFAKNGLFFMQFPRATDEGIEVETLIMHKSQEWISDTLGIPTMRIDPQGYGQAITYARRYSLAPMCGIAPEEDDGNKPTEDVKQVRLEAIKRLSDAASRGIEAFEGAFKDMPQDVRKLIQRDLPGIRSLIPGQPPSRRPASAV